MSNGVRGFGVQFKRGDGQPTETFTAVSEVRDLTGPNPTRDEVDLTHHQSPNDYRETTTSFKDAGEVAVIMNWIPSDPTQDNSTGLESVFETGVVGNYQNQFPSVPPVTYQYACFGNGFEHSSPMDDALLFTMNYRVTGPYARV